MSGQVCGFENEHFNRISLHIRDDRGITEARAPAIVDQPSAHKAGPPMAVQASKLVVIDPARRERAIGGQPVLR